MSSSKHSSELRRLALSVLQPGFVGTEAPDWVLRDIGDGLASVVLFSRNIVSTEQVARLTAQLRAENPDLIVAIDEEAGDVTRIESATGSSRPGNFALGTVDDPALTEAVAADLGRQLRAAGVSLDYAPSADVNSNPDNPIIGVRSFGSDPEVVARHTTAWIRGLQSSGVAACAKHFPPNPTGGVGFGGSVRLGGLARTVGRVARRAARTVGRGVRRRRRRRGRRGRRGCSGRRLRRLGRAGRLG